VLSLLVENLFKKLCTSNHFINIIGLKDVNCDNIKELFDKIDRLKNNYSYQIFDAKAIGGIEHLYFAAVNALKAFNQGLNISKTFSLELLLYVSGQRQISKAIEMVGVKNDTKEIALVIIVQDKEIASKANVSLSKIIGGTRDDSVLEIHDPVSISELYGLDNFYDNITTLKKILIERSALLITQF